MIQKVSQAIIWLAAIPIVKREGKKYEAKNERKVRHASTHNSSRRFSQSRAFSSISMAKDYFRSNIYFSLYIFRPVAVMNCGSRMREIIRARISKLIFI